MKRLFSIIDRWLFAYMARAGLILQCSDAPDTSGLNQAAADSAALSREALAWYKDEYAKTQPQRDAAIAQSAKVSDAQLAGMEYATQQAKDLDARNKTVFQPLEDKIVADAKTFDTAGRRTQAVNEATADVEGAFGRAQDGLARGLARTGVAPGGGRSMSLMQDAALKKATAVAGASTGAVKNVEQQGYARTMDAAALGKGIIGNQATMQQIAQGGGAQAVNASAAALQAAGSGASMMGAGFNTALAGQGQAGNLYGQAAKLDSQDNGLMGALGGIAGQFAGSKAGSTAIASMFSDETMKSGTGKPANTATMLKQIEGTKVDQGWRYDPAKGGPDDGGVQHDGPMAQEVRRTMGEKAAPGGKVIDLATMNATLMGGMQELAKRMKKLERRAA